MELNIVEISEWAAYEGYEVRDVLVVRMLDNASDKRWWDREHLELGRIEGGVFDGPVLVNRHEVKAAAIAAFGDCYLCY